MPVATGDLEKFLADPATTQEDINRLTLTTLDFFVQLSSKQIAILAREMIQAQSAESTDLQSFLRLTAADALAELKTALGGAVELLQWVRDRAVERKTWASIAKGKLEITH